jgi:SpoVK/Ycf46/Vps4 family AAA+-type ATPase
MIEAALGELSLGRDHRDRSAAQAWQDLLPALERLDARLEQAVRQAQAVYAPARAGEQFRGLYTSDDEADALLARAPGEPLFAAGRGSGGVPPESRLARLQREFALTPFDLDVVLLTLAPELDRRYERLYGYLQDNVSLRRPTVDLALHLICADAAERIEERERFATPSPLIAHGIVRLTTEGDQGSVLAGSLKLQEQVIAFLLQQDQLDARLAPHCWERYEGPGLHDLPLDPQTRRALAALIERATRGAVPLRLHLHGVPGSGKAAAAAGVAAAAGRGLITLDLASVGRSADPMLLVQLFRQAVRLRRLVPYLVNADSLPADRLDDVLGPLVEDDNLDIAIVASIASRLSTSAELIAVPFGPLGFEEQRRCWETKLRRRGLSLSATELDELSARLKLTAGQIEEAVGLAFRREQWDLASRPPGLEAFGAAEVSSASLYEAACEESTTDLAALARRLRPHRDWEDLVLPEDAHAQLRELCARVSQRRRVLDEWGFGRRLTLGRGTVALFTGPPGTGKTMAAEIVASQLQLDLCKIDLSSVVSKYIGETEKNLSQIFAAAERANAILFFDEADALFGKRSEVRDSHDRYANIETSYLLQKMEEYDGVAILATNLRQNLDESFIRRIAFTIHFPFPDEGSRAAIWRSVWPAETPLADDVDLDLLARSFKLAGGNIKNVALAAAFLSAEEGTPVTMAHLIQATRREYQKLGKALGELELAVAAV